MCLLTVLEPGATLPTDHATEAACANPDGFGFAIHLGTDVLRFRSLSFSTTWRAWCEARDRWPDRWALWHWRYGTGGGISRAMAHPFRWGGDSRLVVAHNGILPIAATRTQSDTALFADRLRDVDPAALDHEPFMRELGAWAAGSKLAVLSVHPDTACDAYIVNEDAGHWGGGVWYSNRSYLPYVAPPRAAFAFPHSPALWQPPRSGEWRASDALDCGVCGTVFLVPVDDPVGVECPDCGSCWCCDEPPERCECWEPAPAYVHPDYRNAVDAWDTGAAYN